LEPLDFLDAQSGEPDETPVVQPEAIEPGQPEGPARGPDGKFIAREAAEPDPEPQPAPEMQAAPQPEPQAPQVPPGYVPVSVVQELRQEIRQMRQAPQAAPQVPDRYEDPEGYENWREQQIEERLLNQKLDTSERFARKEYGADTVEKARDWALQKFQADPLYQRRIMSDADPYEAVVQDWKREQVLSSMKDGDLDAFLAWKAGQASPQAHQAPAASAAPPITPPTRSLASAPSAGGLKPGEQPVGPGVSYGAVFKG
jgi:hypothetical protein